MTSFRQIEANRRNAQLSTGPVTEEGKKQSRQNAVRHGLTAETVIDALEDAEDYAAFELAVTADYDAQSAVERELVLRLASLLWRLRRATAIGFRPSSCCNSANADMPTKSARKSSTACTKMLWRPMTTWRRRTRALAPRRQWSLLNILMISHAPLSASQICQPIRSTG